MSAPVCGNCFAPATCIGAAAPEDELSYACDDCCDHLHLDDCGVWCEPIEDESDRVQEVP